MADLKDIIGYILQQYPHKSELSNARVTKMVYLADWKQMLNDRHQISGIDWYFDNYGPFVWDVKRAVDDNKDVFDIVHTMNGNGGTKTLFSLKPGKNNSFQLNDCEKKAIDAVIDNTKSLYWDDFITFVYSTYPVASNERYSSLDLKKAADEYQLVS